MALAGGADPLPASTASVQALHSQDVSVEVALKLTDKVHSAIASEAAVKIQGEVEKVQAAERAAEQEAEEARAEDGAVWAVEEAEIQAEAEALVPADAPAPPAPQASAPAQQPPAVAPVAPVTPVPPVADRFIHVGLAGGQDVVDMGAGPVLFPLPAGWPPYVAEHDYHGGWQRFGTLYPGLTVSMTGLITGTYTVGEIITVPRGGTVSDLRFVNMPVVMLQTCIPGTNNMVVVGLY